MTNIDVSAGAPPELITLAHMPTASQVPEGDRDYLGSVPDWEFPPST